MAEHVHKSYSCDRCKADLGPDRPNHGQGAVISAAFNWREGPGPTFKWDDLCDGCRSAVMAFFLPADLHPAQSELREARVWWNEVNDYVNKDMAAYVMARARRMLGGWKP